MREVDLRNTDLRLLVVLNALLEERSVTRAALRVGMSQPAASRSLARLRDLLADPLLVDSRDGYVLTTRASALLPRLRSILATIGELLEESRFDPAKATGTVRLLMLDLEAAILAPPLISRLDSQSPSLDLQIVPPGPNPLQLLEDGSVDALIGVVENAPAGIRIRTLYEDHFLTLMRADHPAGIERLTLDRYLELDHLVVSVTGTGRAWVDGILARSGRVRRIKLRTPSFFAAVEIAARSDLFMTLPSRLARTAAEMRRFVTIPPPLDLGIAVTSLAWHASHQGSPRHIWLREQIVAAAANSE
tara:strand:- start:48108 stop:49019 length:912 start_codon:yes stop_codon:yes gene_type:complete